MAFGHKGREARQPWVTTESGKSPLPVGIVSGGGSYTEHEWMGPNVLMARKLNG